MDIMVVDLYAVPPKGPESVPSAPTLQSLPLIMAYNLLRSQDARIPAKPDVKDRESSKFRFKFLDLRSRRLIA